MKLQVQHKFFKYKNMHTIFRQLIFLHHESTTWGINHS